MTFTEIFSKQTKRHRNIKAKLHSLEVKQCDCGNDARPEAGGQLKGRDWVCKRCLDAESAYWGAGGGRLNWGYEKRFTKKISTKYFVEYAVSGLTGWAGVQ
jgi:hypothetical protein